MNTPSCSTRALACAFFACLLPLSALAQDDEEPEDNDAPDSSGDGDLDAPVILDRSTRVMFTVDYALGGGVRDNDAFSDASLRPAPGFTAAIAFGCRETCLGLALPVHGVNASTRDVATDERGSVRTTTIAPSARVAYVASPTRERGVGGALYLDLGYMLSFGGDGQVAGLYLGLHGDLQVWVSQHVAIAAGVGLEGSPYSVLYYPAFRLGTDLAF